MIVKVHLLSLSRLANMTSPMFQSHPGSVTLLERATDFNEDLNDKTLLIIALYDNFPDDFLISGDFSLSFSLPIELYRNPIVNDSR